MVHSQASREKNGIRLRGFAKRTADGQMVTVRGRAGCQHQERWGFIQMFYMGWDRGKPCLSKENLG